MINDLLVQRIEAIDSACDAAARSVLNDMYRQVRVEGSRLQFPPLADVGRVWLQAIARKEIELRAEVPRVLDAASTIDDETMQALDGALKRVFNEGSYADKLEMYIESLGRSAGRYGMQFRPQDHRSDLAVALYRVGLSSALATARANIAADMQFLLSRRSSTVDLSSLMKDKITVLKKNGDRVEGVKAVVSSDSVVANAAGVLIEPGDLLRRHMSNGAEETFEVIDPGFHEAFHAIPAGYQMKVRKLGLPEAERAVQSITYNLSGPNARINQHSVDNSTNSVAVNPDAIALIGALRSEIDRLQLADDKRSDAVAVVDAVEHQVQGGKPSKVVITTLLKALPHVASVATIGQALAALF